MIPDNLYYSAEHEWAHVEGETVTMGITDFAQEQLGEVTFVELPAEGQDARAGDSIGAIESSKAAGDLYAPVSGQVIEINTVLEEQPELVNESCYEQGWICKIKLDDQSCLDKLMNAQAYEEYLKGL